MAFARKIDHTPIAGQAYAVLKQRILDLEFKPGELLSEMRLAAEFGLSRTPVREALKRLETEGLVDVVPQHGTFVSPIRPELVRNAQYAREALEVALVRDAAACASRAQLAELDGNIAAQAAACTQGDFDELFRLDETMHRTIARIAGRESIWNLIADIKIHMDRARKLTLRPNHAPNIVNQHTVIVEGIKNHDPDRAVDAMRVHLRFVVEHLDELVASFPEFMEERKARFAGNAAG